MALTRPTLEPTSKHFAEPDSAPPAATGRPEAPRWPERATSEPFHPHHPVSASAKIRALIVGDEPLARARIRLLLREEPDIEIIGACPSGPVALAAIKRDPPDLLFLDAQIRAQDGVGVLCAIPRGRQLVVIFTSASAQHALPAFDARALDYVLKSFKPARFKEALQRARERLANRRTGPAFRDRLDLLSQRPARSRYVTRLTVRTGEKVVVLRTADIDAIESAGNYVVVQCGKENHLLRETLSALEAQFDPQKFLRISRSTIVNLDRVKELLPMFRGEHVIVLHNGKRLTMTRSLREVEEALKFS